MNRPGLALLLIVIGAAAGCHFGPPHTTPDDAGTNDEGTPDDSGDMDAPDDAGEAGDAPEQG